MHADNWWSMNGVAPILALNHIILTNTRGLFYTSVAMFAIYSTTCRIRGSDPWSTILRPVRPYEVHSPHRVTKLP